MLAGQSNDYNLDDLPGQGYLLGMISRTKE